MDYNVKDMVKDNKKVKFVQYQKGSLLYKTECGFEFPVPADDTGEGETDAEPQADDAAQSEGETDTAE